MFSCGSFEPLQPYFFIQFEKALQVRGTLLYPQFLCAKASESHFTAAGPAEIAFVLVIVKTKPLF